MASKKLGDLIKEARMNADLTQEQLAKKIAGLSASDISMAERGKKDLTQEQLKRIAKATGVTQKSLLDAAKKFGKEIVNTVAEGSEELQQAAGKFAAEHDMGNITDTVKKNISAASTAFSRHIDILSRDFQDAVEKFEKKQQSAPKAGEPEEPIVEEAAAETAEPQASDAVTPEETPIATEEPQAQEEPAPKADETEYL